MFGFGTHDGDVLSALVFLCGLSPDVSHGQLVLAYVRAADKDQVTESQSGRF